MTAKDIVLAVIAKIGTGGGQGHVIEFRGERDPRRCPWKSRMTVCNMSIEAGARAGHDRAGRDDLRLPPRSARPRTPGAPTGMPPWPRGAELRSDDGAEFDDGGRARRLDPLALRHLGHQPRAGPSPLGEAVPDPELMRRRQRQDRRAPNALEYMGLRAGHSAARGQRWTRSSSGRAPTGGSRTCEPPPTSCKGRSGRRLTCACSWCPGRPGCDCRPRAEGLRRGVHRGRSRVAPARGARCAWG